MNNTGLLVSQIGYDLHAPMHAIYRGELQDGAFFNLKTADGDTIIDGPMQFWGNCWNSDWWVSDFSRLNRPGEYTLTISADGKSLAHCSPFKVGEHLLWTKTAEAVGVEQFERRAELARFGKGWKDCGADAREIGSHTGALIGLLDLLNIGYEWLGRDVALRLAKQVIHGCDYLLTCQDRAQDLGWEKGTLVHEIPSQPVLIPQDQGQAVVALAKASRHIYEIDRERSIEYLRAYP